MLKLVRKGDLVSYSRHVAIVHSDQTTCSGSNCTYEIIHAYGGECLELDKTTGECKPGTFSRKVLRTPNKFKGFPDPSGFGRIKLWD